VHGASAEPLRTVKPAAIRESINAAATPFVPRVFTTTLFAMGAMRASGASLSRASICFLQSMKMSFQGNEVTIKYTWKDGKLASQSMDMMGNPMTFTFTYNDKGAVASQSMDMGGQEMKMEYTDYKYDAKGNWISRKTQMMGQDMEQTRTIEYYE
jgi:hypothetical protein